LAVQFPEVQTGRYLLLPVVTWGTARVVLTDHYPAQVGAGCVDDANRRSAMADMIRNAIARNPGTREPNQAELSLSDLEQVVGGNACSTTGSFKTVGLGLRKSGGGASSAGAIYL
jgi:hypothetical protein